MITIPEQHIPITTLIVIGGCLLLMAMFAMNKMISDVKDGHQRRILQNIVYRMFVVNRWFYSVICGFDHAVNAYYTTNEETAIKLHSETKYPAIIVERMPAPKPEPMSPAAPLLQRLGFNKSTAKT